MFSFSQLEFTLAAPLPAPAPGRDPVLEDLARHLLLQLGAPALAARAVVEWSPRLCAHGEEEIDRTLRHELAHLLAQTRAGRRRLAPHGAEWRRACADLGIADETRCHNLPFPARKLERRYLYRCAHCEREFPRTRPLRRTSACLACCRAFNRGQYDRRFKLQLVSR